MPHRTPLSQPARFPSDWQAQAGSILRCRAARPPTPPNKNLRTVGRHIPLAFEAREFRRYTFDRGSSVRPRNHFGQCAPVLCQFCRNVQLPSRPVHDNVTWDSKNETPTKSARPRQPGTRVAEINSNRRRTRPCAVATSSIQVPPQFRTNAPRRAPNLTTLRSSTHVISQIRRVSNERPSD